MEQAPNKATIVVYDLNAQEYIDKTPSQYQPHHRGMLEWINTGLSYLPKGGRILEVGSAITRDASYMRSKGYTVQLSDASKSLFKKLQEKGERPLLLNLLDDPIPAGYDMLFANAVAPHFTPADLKHALRKVNASLQPQQVFAFNVKRGEGEAWINEKFTQKRYSRYWQPNEVIQEVIDAGFSVVFMQKSAEGDSPSHRWINIVALKK